MRAVEKRLSIPVAAVLLAATVGLVVILGGRSVLAGPDAAPLAAPPNPGHSWSEIFGFPGTIWHSNNDGAGSGLDADTLDGLESDQIQDADDYVSSAGTVSRLGFSRTTVDSAGTVGWYTSVTVGVDGLPVISYHHYTNDDLKVAHCGNAACSAGNTITTVDSAGTVGWYTSVTVGADGLPLISYWDWSNGDLKVAHCGNAACSSGNTITTVDSASTVSWYSSVTVGVDGLPVISYLDGTNSDLKVAHCSNRFCVPYHRPR